MLVRLALCCSIVLAASTPATAGGDPPLRITDVTAPATSARGGVLWLTVGISRTVDEKVTEVQQRRLGRWVTIDRRRRSGSPGLGIVSSARPIGGGSQTFRVVLRAGRTIVSRPVTVRLVPLPGPHTPICRTAERATMISDLAWVACVTPTGPQLRAYDLTKRRPVGAPLPLAADIVDFDGTTSTLWLLGRHSVVPVALGTRTAGRPIPLPDPERASADSIEVQGPHLWVLLTTRTNPLDAQFNGQRLLQIDAATGAVIRSIDLPPVTPEEELVEPYGILAGRTAVFIPRRNDIEGFRRVFRIDVATGALTTLTGGHAVGDGPAGVWIANDQLVRLDGSGRFGTPGLARMFLERLTIGSDRIWGETRRFGTDSLRVLYATFDARTGRTVQRLRPIGPDIPEPLGGPRAGVTLLSSRNVAYALSTTDAAIWRLP